MSVGTYICTRDVLWVHGSSFYREVQILYVVRAQMACKEIFYKKKAKHVPVYMCHEVLWELRLGHQDPLSLYRNNLRVWAGLFTDRLRLVTVVEILFLISFQSYVIFTTQHQPSVIGYHSRPQICDPFGQATTLDPLRWPQGSQFWGREWYQ